MSGSVVLRSGRAWLLLTVYLVLLGAICFLVYEAESGTSSAFDDPFSALDSCLRANVLGGGVQAAVVDFHAEATSEKMAMGHWCDGRASLVVGTHTHVPTADTMILPRGTA